MCLNIETWKYISVYLWLVLGQSLNRKLDERNGFIKLKANKILQLSRHGNVSHLANFQMRSLYPFFYSPEI